MKLIIGLHTFSVTECLDFDKAADPPTHNGQHQQLKGRVLAEVRISGMRTTFSLLHPDTGPGTGHVDVYVEYEGDNLPTFHYYSQHEKFVPQAKPIGTVQDLVWPTGGWSLIQVVLAIESYLEEKIGFTPALRNSIFAALAPVVVVP